MTNHDVSFFVSFVPFAFFRAFRGVFSEVKP
jgi:hypothetical protein